jgi:hypothetical protein
MKLKTPLVRPLKKADLKSFDSFNYSVRGVAVEIGGEVVSVSGVLHSSPPQAFSFMKDELRKYPKTIMKVILEFKDILNHYKIPIYAKCSNKEKNSRKVLERIGFELVDGRFYRWNP